MSLTAAQIITLAAQAARVPGMVSQAGQFLNAVLQDLAQDYDFEINKRTYNFNFNLSQVNSLGQSFQDFPQNYLRGIMNECFYVILGVPYPMIPCDLAEFDMLVQQTGFQNFPMTFTVDMSATPPRALFWMPPSGAYPVTVRYFCQPDDIVTPETSAQVPWFPNQVYLIRRVAGELMQITDDDRMAQFLGDNAETAPNGAGVILRRYLQMQGDKENRVNTVKLDRRRFGMASDRLRNTKQIGW